jgi:hypothetical protein
MVARRKAFVDIECECSIFWLRINRLTPYYVLATEFAEASIKVVVGALTAATGGIYTAGALTASLHLLHEFSTDDAGWHCDNRVTANHSKGGDKLTERGLWSNVAIAYRSDGDDSPIDRDRNVNETIRRAFDDKH